MHTELDLFPLSERWKPNKLLIRDKQLNTLLDKCTRKFPENFWITGDRGLGKTLTAELFCQRIEGSYLITFRSHIFRETMRDFALTHGIIPRSTDHPITLMMKVFEKEGYDKIVIFMDDVDKLGRYLRRDFGVYLHDLYDRLQETYGDNFSINIITTRPYQESFKIIKGLAESRLKLKPLLFPRYSKKEIVTLLNQRLQYIEGLKVEQEAVETIGDIISRIGGDFRKALHITRNAILNSGNLTTSAVKEAWKLEKMNFWRNQILDLPYHAALLLGCIVEETVKQHGELKGEPPYFPAAWSHIKNRYRRRCMKFGVEPQNQKMLYYWLEQLWLKGWIDKFTLSKKHEFNYTGKRELYIRILEKLENLIPAMKEIDWSEPW